MLHPRSSGGGVAATRRTALAGALGGALAVAGCDAIDPDADPDAEPSATPASSSRTATGTPDDPDAALVDEVVAELDELIAFTASAAAARPRVGPWPAAFERLHRAHREVLTDDHVDESEPSPVRGSAQDVARQVTRREGQAHQQLAEWAVAAQSGQLARLLASMSAAVAQQLAAPVKAAG